MFGYVAANQAALTPEEERRYRGVYCGLCRALRMRHGLWFRFALNYDMAFLVVLLDSLYEPESAGMKCRCLMHPIKPRECQRSLFTDYAADMTVALTYHKCLDDWRDDHNIARLLQARLIRGRYHNVAAQWPGKCCAMEDALSDLRALEKRGLPDVDAAAACFGRLMGELFAARDDQWAERLRQVGGSLGRFVYMMDAWEDLPRDKRRGHYNPLIPLFDEPDYEAQCRESLTMLIGLCTREFEKLPLEQDLSLMRNILYSGVWSRYELRKTNQGKETGR